jgi:prepilin-type N-terminal cleavage/methylation domain-containing protein
MEQRHGFTLIELSIVLVIIGLIAGAILVGRDLIHAAQVVKTISQIQQLQTAINSFRLTYGQLPGDFDSATAYWPNAVNGNNDGMITATTNPFGQLLSSEGYNVMNQLSAAGLVAGTFTPWTSATAPVQTNYSTVLSVALDHEYLRVYYATVNTDVAAGQLSNRITMLQSGSDGSNSNLNNLSTLAQGGGVWPTDALSVDVKIDDGLPMTGAVTHSCTSNAAYGGTCGILSKCLDPGGANAYNLADTKSDCAVDIDLK